MSFNPYYEVSNDPIALGYEHTIFKKTDGKFFLIGNNQSGQLLNPSDETNESPDWDLYVIEMDRITYRKNDFTLPKTEKISRVFANLSDHTIVLSEKGKLFGAGLSTNCQIGRDVKKSKSINHIKFFDEKTILDVIVGGDFTYVVTTNGVYSFGRGAENQLVVKGRIVFPPELVPFPKGKLIKKIRCGEKFTVFLFHDYTLYQAGENFESRGNKEFHEIHQVDKTPTKDLRIKNIYCGGHYYFVVSKSGRLYGIGENNSGQLGISNNDMKIAKKFTHVKKLEGKKILDIGCGFSSTCFVTEYHGHTEVFFCGHFRYRLKKKNFQNVVYRNDIVKLVTKRKFVRVLTGMCDFFYVDEAGEVFRASISKTVTKENLVKELEFYPFKKRVFVTIDNGRKEKIKLFRNKIYSNRKYFDMKVNTN